MEQQKGRKWLKSGSLRSFGRLVFCPERPSRCRVNLIQMIWYDGPSSKNPQGFDNSYMLDMIALYPDTFVGTAVIDVFGTDPAGLMTELAKKKVRAFRIMPLYSRQPVERWLQQLGYDKMFAAGARPGD